MKARAIAWRQSVAARHFGTGAKVAALLGMAAGLLALALLVAGLVAA